MKLKSALPTPCTAEEQIKEIEALRKERDNLIEELKVIWHTNTCALTFALFVF